MMKQLPHSPRNGGMMSGTWCTQVVRRGPLRDRKDSGLEVNDAQVEKNCRPRKDYMHVYGA